MKFGAISVDGCTGAILAHAVKTQGLSLKKGEVITETTRNALIAAGISEVIAAELEADDVPENQAALTLAARLAGSHLVAERAFTGRCNLLAEASGLLLVDGHAVDRLNDVDEAITLATLPPFRRVSVGEMVATVKIIPFAVPRKTLRLALDHATSDVLGIAPFLGLRVGVVSTLLPGLKPSTVAKTLDVMEARLALSGASIDVEQRVPHTKPALASAIEDVSRNVDLVVVFGASAITDRRDVVPCGIEEAGGRILQLGMPVDPGNLLLLAELPRRERPPVPVVGAPGCARSAKENGFDHVLLRLMAGLSVEPSDLRHMGVGGLLNEITSRPQPREPEDQRDGGRPRAEVGRSRFRDRNGVPSAVRTPDDL